MSTHVSSRGRMGDSNHTIDDSYMVLGQQVRPPDFLFTTHAHTSKVGLNGHI